MLHVRTAAYYGKSHGYTGRYTVERGEIVSLLGRMASAARYRKASGVVDCTG